MIRFITKQRKFILATGLGLAVLSSPVIAQETTASKTEVVRTTAQAQEKSASKRVKKVNYSPQKATFLNSGVASYYGPGFHGRRTANGETFNMNALTAAHRTLPFGTLVKVTNLSNGKSAIVRVNDRGPYVGKRVIDLSVAAAKQIGSTGSGTARVSLEVMN